MAHNPSVYFNDRKENSNVGNRKQPVWTTHCQNNHPGGLFIRNLLSSKSIHYDYEEINIILYETLNYEAKQESNKQAISSFQIEIQPRWPCYMNEGFNFMKIISLTISALVLYGFADLLAVKAKSSCSQEKWTSST